MIPSYSDFFPSILAVGLLLCSSLVTAFVMCQCQSFVSYALLMPHLHYLDYLSKFLSASRLGVLLYNQYVGDRSKILSSYCFTTSQKLGIFLFTPTIAMVKLSNIKGLWFTTGLYYSHIESTLFFSTKWYYKCPYTFMIPLKIIICLTFYLLFKLVKTIILCVHNS